MKNKAAVALGRIGGKKKSEAKTRAARENARKGAALRRQRGIEQLAETIGPESAGASRTQSDLEKTPDSQNSGQSC